MPLDPHIEKLQLASLPKQHNGSGIATMHARRRLANKRKRGKTQGKQEYANHIGMSFFASIDTCYRSEIKRRHENMQKKTKRSTSDVLLSKDRARSTKASIAVAKNLTDHARRGERFASFFLNQAGGFYIKTRIIQNT